MDSTRRTKMKTDEILLPHDEELEKEVLSGLIGSSLQQCHDWLPLLSDEDFFEKLHAGIFRAIKKCVEKGDAPDFALVVKELGSREHMADVAAICSTYNTSQVNMRSLCLALSDLRKRRRLVALGYGLVKASQDTSQDISDVSNKAAEELQGILSGGPESLHDGVDVTKVIWHEAEERLKNNTPTGSKTGFRYLDGKGGFQPTNLILICAESSQGKTAFAVSIVRNIAENGDRVAFFSLEMDERQLMSRILAPSTNIAPNRLLTGKLDGEEFKALDDTLTKYENAYRRIFFDDKDSSTIDSILNAIRRLHAKVGITGVFIDYLQIIPSSGNRWETTEQERLASAARRLKNIAKELNIWVCALSQLSRDKENRPSVDRLRGSGQINEAADMTMLLWRPEVYNRRDGKDLKFKGRFKDVPVEGKAQVTIAKGRNVGEGDFLIGFDPEHTHFFDIDEPKAVPHPQESANEFNFNFYEPPY